MNKRYTASTDIDNLAGFFRLFFVHSCFEFLKAIFHNNMKQAHLSGAGPPGKYFHAL
jgi:hypothetical protein